MPYHIDEENSELAFEVREGNKLVIKIKSNIFSDSLELYLIKVGDNTEPTDKNVFSSLRVLKEIENLHDTILKEINSVTSGFWELKQDSQGNEYISTKYNVLTEGGLTTYGLGEQKLGTIYDGLPIDNDTIYWEEVEGSRVLKAKGSGGEAGSVQWGNISGKPTWIEDTKPTYNWYEIQGEKPFYTKEEVAAKFVTIDTEQEITALKHFTAGLSVGESKKKIYEENGVVYIDADVAVTGAMTFYATAGRTVSTIMDAVAVDGITITKEGNVLKAVSGSGSNFDKSAMWTALAGSTTEQINKSHLTTALTGYATESWVSGKNYAVKATTLAGYGITDAYTKKESDGKYPTKTGSGASGTWGIGITGNAGSASKLQNASSLWGNNFDGTTDVIGKINASNGIQLPYRGSIVTQFGNLLRTDYSEGDYNDFFELTARGSGSSENKLLGGNSGLLTWSGNRFVFNSYGNGWYVEDNTWIRTYGGLFVPQEIQVNGNINCGSSIKCNGTMTAGSIDLSYGTNYKFVRMSWNGTSGDVASFFVPGSTSQWFTMELRSDGVLYTNGNILATGGATFYGSDIRYKSIMQQVNLSLLDIAKAPSFVYRWNKKGMKRDRLNLGGSAQYTQSILPWAVENSNNFLSMDYATVAYTFAVHTARHLLTYETRTDKKIKKLENRVKYLEKQLKKLGYEEVRTLDDSGI